LVCASAGHPALLIYKKNEGRIISLKPSGPVIGWFDNAVYETLSVDVASGDKIILYTDGITEAVNENNEEFGDNEFNRFIEANKDDAPKLFIDKLFNAVKDWTQIDYYKDDLTIIVIDVK
jgi:sigma-B regulation protein RsbU (phosphoserine phosphatase)